MELYFRGGNLIFSIGKSERDMNKQHNQDGISLFDFFFSYLRLSEALLLMFL